MAFYDGHNNLCEAAGARLQQSTIRPNIGDVFSLLSNTRAIHWPSVTSYERRFVSLITINITRRSGSPDHRLCQPNPTHLLVIVLLSVPE